MVQENVDLFIAEGKLQVGFKPYRFAERMALAQYNVIHWPVVGFEAKEDFRWRQR